MQVVFFKKFDPQEEKSLSADFILFGNSKEQFLAHHITDKPDFEQIIQVKATPSAFILNEKFALVTLATTGNKPIGVSSNKVFVNDVAKKQSIILLKQIYLEFDDLKE